MAPKNSLKLRRLWGENKIVKIITPDIKSDHCAHDRETMVRVFFKKCFFGNLIFKLLINMARIGTAKKITAEILVAMASAEVVVSSR